MRCHPAWGNWQPTGPWTRLFWFESRRRNVPFIPFGHPHGLQRGVSDPRHSVRAVDVPEIQCECRMRELEAAGYGPDAYLRIISGQIGRIGWAVQGVPGDEQWPSWAYSIGLWHTFRVPELALFGLSLPNMAAIINEIGRRIAD